jgi:hypothetical protein
MVSSKGIEQDEYLKESEYYYSVWVICLTDVNVWSKLPY